LEIIQGERLFSRSVALNIKSNGLPTPTKGFSQPSPYMAMLFAPLGAPTHLHLSDSAKDIAMPDSYDIMKCHKIYMHYWFVKGLVNFHETFRDHRLSLKIVTMPFLLVTLPSLHRWKETKFNVTVHLPRSTVKMKYAWLKTTSTIWSPCGSQVPYGPCAPDLYYSTFPVSFFFKCDGNSFLHSGIKETCSPEQQTDSHSDWHQQRRHLKSGCQDQRG